MVYRPPRLYNKSAQTDGTNLTRYTDPTVALLHARHQASEFLKRFLELGVIFPTTQHLQSDSKLNSVLRIHDRHLNGSQVARDVCDIFVHF